MYQCILVPIDGSPTSAKGLDEAIKLARLTGARLRLLHVLDVLNFATGFETYAAYAGEIVPLMREAGGEILARGQARVAAAGLAADTSLIESNGPRTSDIVVEQARLCGADLIVIGTHGRRGVGRVLMGSDAEQILRTAPVPVLLVRAPQVEGDAGTATTAR